MTTVKSKVKNNGKVNAHVCPCCVLTDEEIKQAKYRMAWRKGVRPVLEKIKEHPQTFKCPRCGRTLYPLHM